MSADLVFSIANATAVIAWILLVLFPNQARMARLTGTAVPLMFALSDADVPVRPRRLAAVSAGPLRSSLAAFAHRPALEALV